MTLQTVTLAVALLTALAGHAQGWPHKPVRLIVPYPPGGGTDVAARLIGDKLAHAFGQQVIVDNRAGAAGAIGTADVARAAPDGHTLLFTADAVTTLHITQKDLQWHIVRDFAPVTQVTIQPLAVAVHASVPANNIYELIALMKSNPGKYSFATTGTGTPQHMAGELLKQMAGVDMAHVPYKGGAHAVQDLVAGQVPIAVLGPTPLVPHARAGRIKVLAFTTRERFAPLPEVPTLQEAGLNGFHISQWLGVLAPARTGEDVIQRVQAETKNALSLQDVRERLAQAGQEPVGSTPREFAAQIRTDIERWTKLARAIELKPH